MNLGAFAGGVAQGINFGVRNKREMLRAQQEEQAMKDEDALRKEQEALNAKYFSAADQSANGTATAQPQVDGKQEGENAPAGQNADSGNQQQPPPRIFNGSLADAMDYATESAKIRMKYGKADPSDMVNMIRLKRAAEAEGDADAIGLLHVGDVEGALNAYNSTGNEKVQLKGAPQQGVYKFAGQELPTVIATVVTPDGKERTINTAQYMTSKIGMDRQLDMLMKNLDSQRDSEYKNAVLDETRRSNIVKEGLMKMGSRGDTRGTVGKDFDDLAAIYGPDQAKAMIGDKYGKKEISDYQRVQALDKVQSIIDSNGGVVDERNAAQVNAMLRSIGEPGYERVIDHPEKKGIISDTPATYKWVPGSGKADGVDNRTSSTEGGRGNNNVGNMRVPGSDTDFQKFDTPEESISAIDKQLSIYGKRDGVDTLSGVISKWSPANENNTNALIENASRITGFKPNQKIDLNNPAIRAVVTAAIIRQEGSKAYLSGIGKVGGNKQENPKGEDAPSKNEIVAKQGVNFWNDPNSKLAGSVDVGAIVGKPMAAMGESVGKNVAGTVDSLKNVLTADEYAMTRQMFLKGFDIGSMIKDMGVAGFKAYLKMADGNPAKNTEQYMERTSSKNLNQYFR